MSDLRKRETYRVVWRSYEPRKLFACQVLGLGCKREN